MAGRVGKGGRGGRKPSGGRGRGGGHGTGRPASSSTTTRKFIFANKIGIIKKNMPIITLTTDFGTKDHFVGAVKGSIYGELDEVIQALLDADRAAKLSSTN